MQACSIIVLFLILLSGCSAHNDNVVVITDTKSYHKEDCPQIKMARTEYMTIDSARKRGMEPCPGCMKEHEANAQ
jgi:uncharacterized protein YcfL